MVSNSQYGVLEDVNNSGSAEEDKVIVYKTYCSRWLMLILFSGLTFTNSFLWISFSSIEVYTAEYFEVSRTEINMLSVKAHDRCQKKHPQTSFAASLRIGLVHQALQSSA